MQNSLYYKRDNFDSTGVIVEPKLISTTDVDAVIKDLDRYQKNLDKVMELRNA